MVLPGKQSRSWLHFALAALFFFGATNFILGFISEKNAGNPDASINAAMILWLGAGILGLAGACCLKISGRGFSGLPRENHFVLPVIAGVTLALGMLLLKISLAANPLAKGPIVAITSSNSLVVTLLAWGFLREKLSPGQWAGFFITVAGIIVLSLSGKAVGQYGAVFYAVIAMILFGLTNFILKLAGEQGSDSVTAAVVLWLSVGACGLLAFAWRWLEKSHFPDLQTPFLDGLALLAGIFLALGMLGIKKAVTLGQAGPASAVSGSNAVLVSLLDYGLLGHWLPSLKLAGMLVVISGIVALALAKPVGKG
jgi:drug/metabolite transporter (DMT)-like permease